VDPWTIGPEVDAQRQSQLETSPHPLAELIGSHNTSKTRQGKQVPQRRRLVSFGKIVSTLFAKSVSTLDNVDELQLFFYVLNERAGKMAGRNIAEFPIDLDMWRGQLQDHIERRRTDAIPVEEVIQLLKEAQVNDVRSLGYGFSAFFEPYDDKKRDPKLRENQEQNFQSAIANVENGRGPFKRPEISFHVETTYATPAGTDVDLLTAFDLSTTSELSGASRSDRQAVSDKYRRVMRVHVFDKQVDPYPLTTTLLRADDDVNSPRFSLTNQQLKGAVEALKGKVDKSLSALPPEIASKLQADVDKGVVIRTTGTDPTSNDDIKKMVSRTMPSIIFGANASNVRSAALSSVQDPTLSSVQMMANRSGRPSVTQPNGGGTAGLPLRIIPASMQLTSMGCPLINYAQLYFVDFNTGTTTDNVYNVTGITHTLSPGRFETSTTMTYADAYGQYECPPTILKYLSTLAPP
jgi:hypothetical protein